MQQSFRPSSSFLALVVLACSGSGAEQTSTAGPNGFIAEDEAAGNAEKGPSADQAAGVDVSVPVRTPPSGPQGSGVVVAQADDGSWLVPDEGASFTGPPLQAGEGPASADACPDQSSIASATESAGESICFFSEDDPVTPAARIDQVIESVAGESYVHIRLTLNPNFVDNSYGDTAVGWGTDATSDATQPVDGKPPPKAKKPKTHTFKDLVGSDHAEIKLTDAEGNVVLHFKVDYLSEDDTAPSGYASLGVSGGEGKVLVGDPNWILQATTSLDRNLNACGYADFIENSPVPPTLDDPAEAENWDYRVVYEVWVSLDAFGDSSFGEAFIDFVHASPSKGSDNTVDVTAGPCPPDGGDPPGAGGSGGATQTEDPGGAPNGGGGASSGPVDVQKAR
jgi:hypothetical protein